MTGIVVGVDGSAAGRAAVRWAVQEAVLRGVSVRALRAWQPGTSFGYPVALWLVGALSATRRAAEALAARQLEEACGAVAGASRLERRSEAVLGEAAHVLVEAGRSAELLVVGCRSGGALSRAVLGSVSAPVLHHAPCDVAAVPAPVAGTGAPVRVLVGVDHSMPSLAALRAGVVQARRRGAALVPVLVRSPDRGQDPEDGGETDALRLAALVAGADGLPIAPLVLDGHAGAVLEAVAAPQDLLVVGSRGRGGFAALLLGSTTTAVLQHARCPVLVVPGGRASEDPHSKD